MKQPFAFRSGQTDNPVEVNVSNSSGPPPRQPEEFERFEDLTSKLAKVPKSEVDAKRKG
jgi:hypothetical protein